MIKITTDDFSIDEGVYKVKKKSGNVGGVVTFLGVVKGLSGRKIVKHLQFECYREMAEKQLREIRDNALEKFDVSEVSMIHRIGEIDACKNVVLMVVGAEHRKDAFDACEYCIDELKKVTPVWKKEIYS